MLGLASVAALGLPPGSGWVCYDVSLGIALGHCGPSWAKLWQVGAEVGPSWATLAPSWGQVVPSWGVFHAGFKFFKLFQLFPVHRMLGLHRQI